MALSLKTVTAAQVIHISGPYSSGIAGENLTRGQWIYRDQSDADRIKLANATDITKTEVIGMVLNDANEHNIVRFARPGAEVDPGFATVAGETYILGDVDGGIGVIKQNAAETAFKVTLGNARDTSLLRISIHNAKAQYTWS